MFIAQAKTRIVHSAQCIVHSKCVACSHYLDHFAKQNTLIVHCALCIVPFEQLLEKCEFEEQFCIPYF